jgi:hypothetical protein
MGNNPAKAANKTSGCPTKPDGFIGQDGAKCDVSAPTTTNSDADCAISSVEPQAPRDQYVNVNDLNLGEQYGQMIELRATIRPPSVTVDVHFSFEGFVEVSGDPKDESVGFWDKREKAGSELKKTIKIKPEIVPSVPGASEDETVAIVQFCLSAYGGQRFVFKAGLAADKIDVPFGHITTMRKIWAEFTFMKDATRSFFPEQAAIDLAIAGLKPAYIELEPMPQGHSIPQRTISEREAVSGFAREHFVGEKRPHQIHVIFVDQICVLEHKWLCAEEMEEGLTAAGQREFAEKNPYRLDAPEKSFPLPLVQYYRTPTDGDAWLELVWQVLEISGKFKGKELDTPQWELETSQTEGGTLAFSLKFSQGGFVGEDVLWPTEKDPVSVVLLANILDSMVAGLAPTAGFTNYIAVGHYLRKLFDNKITHNHYLRRIGTVIAHEFAHLVELLGTDVLNDDHCEDKACIFHWVVDTDVSRSEITFCSTCQQLLRRTDFTVYQKKRFSHSI